MKLRPCPFNGNITLSYQLLKLTQSCHASCRNTNKMKMSMTYRIYLTFLFVRSLSNFCETFKMTSINNIRSQNLMNVYYQYAFLDQNSAKVERFGSSCPTAAEKTVSKHQMCELYEQTFCKVFILIQ